MSNSLKSKKDKADKKGRTVVEKTLSRKTAKVQLQSKLRTLLDFAEKNQIPFTAFYLHPEDEKEQAPVGFTNAGDAFIFQSIWTMITNNERVGIQFTRMLLEKQEKAMEESGIELPHKKKPMPFQEGDQVKLLHPSVIDYDGPARGMMELNAGKGAVVVSCTADHVMVRPQGDELTYSYPHACAEKLGQGADTAPLEVPGQEADGPDGEADGLRPDGGDDLDHREAGVHEGEPAGV